MEDRQGRGFVKPIDFRAHGRWNREEGVGLFLILL
jgi:hypothetical protein